MVWSRQLQTELILPSDETPGIGSGVFYIGPNLPPDLVDAGFTSAIIWWANEADFENTHVEYQFIGYRPSSNTPPYVDVVHGYMSFGVGLVTQQIWRATTFNDTYYTEIDGIFRTDDFSVSPGNIQNHGKLDVNHASFQYAQTNNQDESGFSVNAFDGLGLAGWELDTNGNIATQALINPFDPVDTDARISAEQMDTTTALATIVARLSAFADSAKLLLEFVGGASIVGTTDSNNAIMSINNGGNSIVSTVTNIGSASLVVGTGVNSDVSEVSSSKVWHRTQFDDKYIDETVDADSAIVTTSVSLRNAIWTNNGTDTWLTDTNPLIDEWQGPFTTTGTAGGTTYTATVWWRMTYDRIVDVRGSVAFAALPTTQNLNITLDSSVPTPDIPPGFSIPDIQCLIWIGSPTRVPIGGFLQASEPVLLLMRGPATTAPGNQVFFQQVYTIAKP